MKILNFKFFIFFMMIKYIIKSSNKMKDIQFFQFEKFDFKFIKLY